MVRRRKSTTTLRSLSIADLQALLEKKISQERKKLPALQKKRDKLASQLEAIDAEIAAIGGSAPSRRGAAKRRGRRPGKATGTIRAKRGGKMTIPAAIHQVLEKAGKPMKSADIRDAIIKQKLIKGRKKSFAAQVNIALNRHKVFKKKGRGVYSL
jgi:hypothetical protein